MDHYEPGKRVTWLSVAGNVTLGLIKCVVGYLANSRALIADGLHALTDLGSDFAVLLGIRYASAPPDHTHPYGHHKFATLVSLVIAGSILAFCALLILDSVRALQAGTVSVPHWPALAVALGSIVVKEYLYYRTRAVGRRLHSQMLLANAVHHRADSVTSLIAVLGIGGALVLGPSWAFLDALVGIVLGAYLAGEGLKLAWRALRDLVDTAPEQSVIDDLREHILPTPGAVAYHEFRARRIGDMIEIDFHLLVPPMLSIQDAHAVAKRVKEEILARHPEVINVLIHVEPALPEHMHDRGIAGGATAADIDDVPDA